MNKKRCELYAQLEKARDSKVLTYVTGDRPGLETYIHSEVFDYFSDHLDTMGVVPKITLFLYTRGGDGLAGRSLTNLLRLFCDDLEVVVPTKCHSAGTLMALGADRIIMTKQAMLGPIDPTIMTSLNPKVDDNPSSSARAPVSVEAIKGYTQLAKEEFGIKDDESLAKILVALSGEVHPLVLGEVTRARSQIKMLAERLLEHQVVNAQKRKKIVEFLCSDSGSHDYTINRREAAALGLAMEKPGEDLYALIKKIYTDIRDELRLEEAYNPNHDLGDSRQINYVYARALVESIGGGTHRFTSEGELKRVTITDAQGVEQEAINDTRTFEGWKHEKAK